MYTEQLTQALSVQGHIPPQSLAAATPTKTSAGVDMQKFRRALFVLDVGAFGSSATVDMKLVESTSANLSSATDVAGTGAAITQLAAAGGNNRLATLEVRAGQVTKRYVGVEVTVGTAATLLCVVALGGEAVQSPGRLSDIAAVAQRSVVA
jgi:hypothetical protein